MLFLFLIQQRKNKTFFTGENHRKLLDSAQQHKKRVVTEENKLSGCRKSFAGLQTDISVPTHQPKSINSKISENIWYTEPKKLLGTEKKHKKPLYPAATLFCTRNSATFMVFTHKEGFIFSLLN